MFGRHKIAPGSSWSVVLIAFLAAAFAIPGEGQTCLTQNDMDAPTLAGMESAAMRYFDMAARGDTVALKQNAIPSLAADFSGVESAVRDGKASFAGAQVQARPPFELKVEGDKPLEGGEFLCGVFNAKGQTANSAAFVIPNLLPGTYGVVTLDVSSAQKPETVSFVLQQQGANWKIGGFYVRSSRVAGHDADWFSEKARMFKGKSQNHDAWLYFLQARQLVVPVSFMYTQKTDMLYDESQSVKSNDIPVEGSVVDFVVAGKTYRLTEMFPVAVSDDLDVVVKYQAADVSNSAEIFKANMVLIHALVAKYPELRDGFSGVVARAVEPSGRDYGAMLEMHDIK